MAEKFKALLVDDQLDFVEPIAYWMKSKGYDVRMASNGKDALEMVEENPPDIILLDIKMPVMDGIETLTKLRADYKTLPVIMITAESDQLEHLQDMGISGFFPKTGDLTQLEQLLDPILRIQAKMKSKE